MTITPQTEASRLADAIREDMREWFDGTPRFLMPIALGMSIITELRSLDVENQRLVAKLDQLRELLTKATVTERKACAKVVRQQSFFRHFDANMARDQCYAAILARGDK